MLNTLSNIDFRFYYGVFVRRLPLFLTVLIVSGAIGFILVLSWPPSYRATATILVESPQIPTDLARSIVPTNAAEQFQVVQQDVTSSGSLLALADRFELYGNDPGATRATMLADMQRRIEIVPMPVETGGGAVASLFLISFRFEDPNVAADLVNALVGMILNRHVQLRTARANDTVRFFTGEAVRLEAELRALDGRILAFKNEHIDALPESLAFRRNQLMAQQQRLLVLAQEEEELRRRQNDLQLRPLEAGASPATPEEQSLLALKQSLAQQQGLFAENSPTIKTLRSRIASLEQAIKEPSQGDSGAARELARIESRIAAIGQTRADIDQSIKELSASIAATPGNETALNSLLRDYQQARAQHEAATRRLAEASTGQQIELLLKGERLSLIEAAEPPQAREGLGQRPLMLASFGAAFMLALAAVAAPELVNRRIRRPAELISRLQIAPFITVPFIRPSVPAKRLSPIVAPLLVLGAAHMPSSDALMAKERAQADRPSQGDLAGPQP